VNSDLPAQLLKTRGEHRSHAINGGLHVAWGFKGNELLDGVENGRLPLTKGAQL